MTTVLIIGIVIAVIVATIITLSIIIHGQRKKIKSQKKDIKANKEVIKKQSENLVILQDYYNAADEIGNSEKELLEVIKEAKTKDEVKNVIVNIIDANNRRVRERASSNKLCTPGKTKKKNNRGS